MKSHFVTLILLFFALMVYQGCGQPTSLKSSTESGSSINPDAPGEDPLNPGLGEDPLLPDYPDNPIPANVAVNTIATGHNFTEGPAYHAPTNSLYYSDLNFNDFTLDRVYVLNLNNQVKQIWKDNANGTNGLMFDQNDNLVALEGRTSRRVVRHPNLANSGQVQPLPNQFEARTLNAPNDLDIHPDGSIFFTDPIYNTDPNDPNPLPFRGVFRQDAQGVLTVAIREGFDQPNGIVFSPAYDRLYVSDSASDHLKSFAINPDGSLAAGVIIYEPDPPTPAGAGGIDGITADAAGNIYLSGAQKITVVDSDGILVGEIPIGERTTNCAFGGPENKTLFVTAQTTIRAIELLIPGKK